MFITIQCECGESDMFHGRCVGCQRVRPSVRECMQRISEIQRQMTATLDELYLAAQLESGKGYVSARDDVNSVSDVDSISMDNTYHHYHELRKLAKHDPKAPSK